MAELVDAVTRKLVLKSERLTSKEIVYLRKQLQLTQTELADHLGGVGQVTVSRWETGDQAMRAPAERLLRVLAYAHVQGKRYSTACRSLSVHGVDHCHQGRGVHGRRGEDTTTKGTRGTGPTAHDGKLVGWVHSAESWARTHTALLTAH
jgi:DNA-binding transcriptional regulator YiaG